MIKKYSFIIFDVDGTLIDTDDVLNKTMYRLYDLYRNGVYAPLNRLYYFSGPPIMETLKDEFPGQDINFLNAEFRRISDELYDDNARLFENEVEVLKSLKNVGYKFGIVSNKVHKSILICLKKFGLGDFFETIVGLDDVINPKPYNEGLLKIFNQFPNINKNQVLYVGDNVCDFVLAKNAGVDCAICNWGPREFPRDLYPTYLLKNYLDLKKVLLDE